MTETTPKVKLSEKFGFLGFSTATNIVYQFKSIYYLFFLTNVLKISMGVAGTILSLGIVWDAINDPLVGYYAVNHRFKNGERVRPFAFWYAVPWAVSMVLIFTNFNASPTINVVLASIAYFLFELLYTCVDIPYNSMGGLATNRDEDRRSINVFRNIGGCFGSGIGAVACLPLLKLFGGLDANGNLSDGSSLGFFKTACVMGLICIAGCFVHYFTTKERVQATEKPEEEEHLGMVQVFKMLYGYKPFLINTVYILLYGIVNLLLLTCITYYATYVLHSTAAATPIQAAYLVTSLVMSLLVGPVDKKLGRKKTMLIGGAFYVVGKIWFIIDPFSIGAIYVNAISMGVAATFTFVMFNTNRNNLTDLIEWKHGRRVDGMIGTADNLSTKLGEALAAKLMTGALAASGFDAALTELPGSAVNAINALLGWVPALVGVGICIIVLFLDIDKEMNKMHAEREAGKA